MASTSSITRLDTAHEDVIHHIEYDFYGKRIVTCSSDQHLKIWDCVERDGTTIWELNDNWKAHDAPILKAVWANPEYGQIIASCSFDRHVKIWEEQADEPKNSQKRWTSVLSLGDTHGIVLDIAFAPIQGSLRLATCSADGIVRIFEAREPTDLTSWSAMEEFSIASSSGLSDTLKSLSHTTAPMATHQASNVSQPSLTQSRNSTSASSNGSASNHTLPNNGTIGSDGTPASATAFAALASGNTSPGTLGLAGPGSSLPAHAAPASLSGNSLPRFRLADADSGYCFDWCPNRTAIPMMVVGLGKEMGARVFRRDNHGRWYPAEPLTGHDQEVYDVSWAPSMARSYQLIATASKDHYVRIFKLIETPNTTPVVAGGAATASQSLQRSNAPHRLHSQLINTARFGRPMQVELVAAFNDHHAEVWRVKWNVTGTILSSSGDDGKVRLWKVGSDGQWRQMAAISAGQTRTFTPPHQNI